MSQSFAEALSWVPVSATFSGTLGRAHEYARAQGHRTVTLEHLLLALAEDPDASTVLQASNIDVARVMSDASTHLGHHEDRFPPGQPVDPAADEALIRILDYAAAAARQSRRREINGAIVLAAIVGEGRSVAASMLQAQGLTFEGAIKALQRAPASPAPRPAVSQLAPVAPASTMAQTVPKPPADAPVTINGAATQTNEQILASVRRRIDANRNAPKAGPVAPPREPYPQPPVTEPVKQAWEEVSRAPVPSPPQPAAPPAVVTASPKPAPVQAEPARRPDPVVPSAPVPTAVAQSPSSNDEYTGLYPPLPEGLPPRATRPFAEDDGLRHEGYEPYPATEELSSPRRPPPLPPAQPARAPVQPQPSWPSNPLGDVPPSPLRPRQFGTPVVPPSTVAWPEPVRPQPAALPAADALPSTRPPAAPQAYNEPNSYDGGIAGAPYPEPDSVPARPVAKVSKPKANAGKLPGAAPVEDGQLAENIPRTMRVGRTEIVEVRIARSNAKQISDGMQGSSPSYLHDLIVTKAMSVRLRAVDGNFQIEPASPETQWLDSHLGTSTDDFASWRWNITPLARGAGRLQLVASARTVASDGLSADTVLPDQIFEISVQADYRRIVLRAAGWAGLMLLGGVLSRIGQGGFETITAMWRGFQ